MPNKKNQFNGHIMWFSGMSGSGKTTLTKAVKSLLDNDGYNTQIIDGDNKRAKDKKKLSFSKKDIIKNNLSIANICNKERNNYDLTMVSVISPYEQTRSDIRKLLLPNYSLIYIESSIDVLKKRDVKGLYEKADHGEIKNLIGYSSSAPYEIPKEPDYLINTNEPSTLDKNIKDLYRFILNQF